MEALVGIGVMVAFIQSTWFLAQVYLAKHRAMMEARTSAWLNALGGCGAGDMIGLYDEVHGRSQTGDALCDDATCEDGDVLGLRSGSTTAPGWFAVKSSRPGTAAYDVTSAPFGSTRLEAAREFACNPEQERRELVLGSQTRQLMQSVGRIVRDEAAPPPIPVQKGCGGSAGNPCSEPNGPGGAGGP